MNGQYFFTRKMADSRKSCEIKNSNGQNSAVNVRHWVPQNPQHILPKKPSGPITTLVNLEKMIEKLVLKNRMLQRKRIAIPDNPSIVASPRGIEPLLRE